MKGPWLVWIVWFACSGKGSDSDRTDEADTDTDADSDTDTDTDAECGTAEICDFAGPEAAACTEEMFTGSSTQCTQFYLKSEHCPNAEQNGDNLPALIECQCACIPGKKALAADPCACIVDCLATHCPPQDPP